MSRLYLLAGTFLGWGLGANDSANIYGTAVYTKIITYRLAVLLTSVFVVLGAVIDGGRGIKKVSEFALVNGITNAEISFFVMFSAGVTVMVMTILKLPVSTSQAVVGAVLGHGILVGSSNLSVTLQFFGAWIFTPIGGMLFALVLYKVTIRYFEKKLTSYKFFDIFIKVGYITSGMFAAYSLGANNVANVFGVFFADPNYLNIHWATILGGLSIALGVITFSKPVMMTVGEGIVPLTHISGFLVVIASALTVYIYARIGIPVSSSQAVVGALIGIGIVKDFKLLNWSLLIRIFSGWILTPTVSGIISIALLMLFGV